MKTFEELRQSAQVLTREQMRMIVGGYTYRCSVRCANGNRDDAVEVTPKDDSDAEFDSACREKVNAVCEDANVSAEVICC